MNVELGLRARKKQQTRDALAQAAQHLFLERGFERTTIDDIAAAADVSRRTYFRYFPTKESVVFSRLDERLALFRRSLEVRAADETPFSVLRRALLGMAELYVANREELLIQHRIISASTMLTAYELEVDRQWEALIVEALAERSDTSPDARHRAVILAGAAIGVVRALLRDWFAGGARDDLKAMGASALDLLERGFGN